MIQHFSRYSFSSWPIGMESAKVSNYSICFMLLPFLSFSSEKFSPGIFKSEVIHLQRNFSRLSEIYFNFSSLLFAIHCPEVMPTMNHSVRDSDTNGNTSVLICRNSVATVGERFQHSTNITSVSTSAGCDYPLLRI
jgi:hypothetical protein